MALLGDGTYTAVTPPAGQPPLNSQQLLLDRYTSQEGLGL